MKIGLNLCLQNNKSLQDDQDRVEPVLRSLSKALSTRIRFRSKTQYFSLFSKIFLSTQKRFRIVYEHANAIWKWWQHTWVVKLSYQVLVRPGITQNLQGRVCLRPLSRRFRLAFEIGGESYLIMLSLLLAQSAWTFNKARWILILAIRLGKVQAKVILKWNVRPPF